MEEPTTLPEANAEPSDTVDVVVEPAVSEDKPGGESDTGSDAAKADTVTDDDSGTADDYLGETNPTKSEPQHDWEKRYADSSREALRQKARADKYEELLRSNPDLADQIDSQETVTPTTSPELEEIKQELREARREKNNEIIRRFEEGKSISKSDRLKMQPYVKALVTHPENPVSLQEALLMAYNHVKGDTKGMTEEAKAKAFAEMQANRQATYSTTGTSRPSSGGSTIRLTQAEYAQAKKLGAVDEDGKVQAGFIKALKEVREGK